MKSADMFYVEQVSTQKMWILGVVIMTILSGCKRRDPNPHLSDLIYQDIVKELRAFEGFEGEALKKVEAAEKELEKSAPRTMERKNAQSSLVKAHDGLVRVQQHLEFLKIREARRRTESKTAYLEGFEKNEPWPNKKEYEAYLVNKKLNLASRNWSERVPQTKKHTSDEGPQDDSKKDAPKGESEETAPAPGH
jgi:hypothetical protein